MLKSLKHAWSKLSRPLTYFSSTRQLAKAFGAELICPVYHVCRSHTPPWWGERYRVKRIQELRSDLEELRKIGPFISLNDLLDYRCGRIPRPSGIFISFDDGYREMASEIAPLLLKMGIPATFFIVSSIIDNNYPFHEDIAGAIRFQLQNVSQVNIDRAKQICLENKKSLSEVFSLRTPNWPLLNELSDTLSLDIPKWLSEEKPYLTQEDVRGLANSGFGIGAHSVDHPLFSEIDAESRITQIRSSVNVLSSILGKPCSAFAFPYGEFGLSAESLNQLFKANVAELYFGTRGITMDEFEPKLIQRMLAEDHPGSFRQLIHRELRLQTYRVQMGLGTVNRRK
jgi:peptidoglycan/xylan/chitin deacetylase (PgdA/CDA1 family)